MLFTGLVSSRYFEGSDVVTFVGVATGWMYCSMNEVKHSFRGVVWRIMIVYFSFVGFVSLNEMFCSIVAVQGFVG